MRNRRHEWLPWLVFLLIFATPTVSFAGGKIRLEKQKKTFYVPRNVSIIRVVRLKFHPTQPKFLLGQITDRRLAVWNLDDPIPEKADKNNREKHIPPTLHCEQEQGWIRGFDIDPQGKWVATGGSDRHLRLWQWTGQGIASEPGNDVQAHDGWIEAVSFSPDGKWIASAGSDRMVKLWLAKDLQPVHTFTGHSGFVRDLAWSPKSDVLVSTGEDGKVIAWNLNERKQVWEVDFGNVNTQQGQNPSFSGALRVAVCPDGKFVSAAGRSKLLLFDLKTGTPLASEKVSYDVRFHPHRQILFGGTDRSKIWNYDPAQLLSSKGKKLGNPGNVVGEMRRQGEGIAFSPDGQWLAVTDRESTVAIRKLSK